MEGTEAFNQSTATCNGWLTNSSLPDSAGQAAIQLLGRLQAPDLENNLENCTTSPKDASFLFSPISHLRIEQATSSPYEAKLHSMVAWQLAKSALDRPSRAIKHKKNRTR